MQTRSEPPAPKQPKSANSVDAATSDDPRQLYSPHLVPTEPSQSNPRVSFFYNFECDAVRRRQGLSNQPFLSLFRISCIGPCPTQCSTQDGVHLRRCFIPYSLFGTYPYSSPFVSHLSYSFTDEQGPR